MTNLTISTLLVQPFINVDQNYIGLADRIFKISKITGISLFLLTSTSNCITFTSYILDIWSVLNPLKIWKQALAGRPRDIWSAQWTADCWDRVEWYQSLRRFYLIKTRLAEGKTAPGIC